MKQGVERVRGVLELMADPHRVSPAVHVAGTNGKTSVARFTAALLDAHGLVTGLFTSPPLQRPEEMFEFGGEVMTREQFAEAVGDAAGYIELFEDRGGDAVTWFEAATIVAFDWFAERAADAMVVEVGLGGPRDATAVLEAPVVVLATAAVEHTEWLGDTVDAVVDQELGVLAPGAALVSGDIPDEAAARAAAKVGEQGGSWLRWQKDFRVDEPRQAVGGWLFDVAGVHDGYEDLFLPLHGRHQIHNFAVAVAAVEALLGRPLDPEAVREAAAGARVPGRMEVVHVEPQVVLDGAHNPAGAAALAAALREEFPTIRWSLVVGAMSDKDLPAMLGSLRGLVGSVHACAADTPRARPAGDVADAATAMLGDDVPVTVHGSVSDALDAARSGESSVLVAGSLLVVGGARAALGLD